MKTARIEGPLPPSRQARGPLTHHTIFIFSLFILLQALRASLPPFVPTRSSHLSPGHCSLPSLLHSTLQRMLPYPISTLFCSPSHHFLMISTPRPPQEASPTPGNRSRTHCKSSRRSRDCDHVLYPRCPWIEREAAVRTGAASGFWSRVCRVIFNPVAVMQH